MRIDRAVVAVLGASALAVASGVILDGERREVLAQRSPDAVQHRPADQQPKFTGEGEMYRPRGWERWVMVGSSVGLSYSEPTQSQGGNQGPGMFHNIYLQPWAYDHFMEHGEFADGTTFVMSMYQASRNADPARGGFYEGDRAPIIEVHVKKTGIDPTGWAFFAFNDDQETSSKVPGSAACYSCHAEKAQFDNAFTQFYPRLRERLGYTDQAGTEH